MNYDVAVIGGGPAGLMAACTAAQRDRSVIIIEKNKILGRKLRITGKGRCNITNLCETRELIENVPTNPSFLYSAFNKFTNYDTVDFFNQLGVVTKVERGMRVFPESDNANEIAGALVNHVKKRGVKICTDTVIKIFNKTIFLANEGTIEAKSIIIATGGASYPGTGSTGDGYNFAKQFGHTVTKITPSLVPLVTREKWTHDLAGLSLKNVEIRINSYHDFGEMLFTHFGLSGPIILSASSHIRDFKNREYLLYVDLKPALSTEDLDKRLQRDFDKYANKIFSNSLNDLLPRKIIDVIVNLSGIPSDIKVHQISRGQRQSLVALLKNLPITIIGTRPICEAIITSGGISTSEINPSTMESKKIPGLYFAGEVIDVDAYTGGFNLQIAFSTGYLAGLKA